MTKRILVTEGKYNTDYYDVSTDKLLHKVCCRLLKERLAEGEYELNILPPTYLKDTLGMTEEEINNMPAGEIKEKSLESLAIVMKEIETSNKEKAFMEAIKRCLKTPYNPKAKQGMRLWVRFWAWGLLQSRSDYEYEKVKLDYLKH